MVQASFLRGTMRYDELTILIPGHTLEDFPTELGEEPSAGLLNAFAVAWHPRLLADGLFPRWWRADEPPESRPNQLILVPSACDDHLPQGWVEEAREAGATVVTGFSERSALLSAILTPLGDQPSLNAELVADFLALGHVWLQTELLARHMRQFEGSNEDSIRREAISGAKATLAGDETAARTHLQRCFEMLLEVRERFYPVNCYLLDLCLLIPRLAGDDLQRLLESEPPFSLMATVDDLATSVQERPALQELIRKRWAAGTVDVVGGELRDLCTPLLSLDSIVRNLQSGHAKLQALLGQTPFTWGRRRYGLGPLLPQVLSRMGYGAALHLALDDGLYPDEEYAKLQWQGTGPSSIPAYSRIPLAGDSASAFLRFPVRMAESMDNDHVAAVTFARWPEMKTPWLDDFRRAHRYAPVLGKFITFQDLFSESDSDGRMSEFRRGTYLSPFLVQAVARRERAPVSRYVDYWQRQRGCQAAEWCSAVSDILRTGRVQPPSSLTELRDQIESAIEPAASSTAESSVSEVDRRLQSAVGECSNALSQTLLGNGRSRPGMLVLNPLSFARRVVVDWPRELALPAGTGPVVARQFDADHRAAVVEVPPCGYVWLAADDPNVSPPPAAAKLPLAESLLVRNELFEVTLSEVTGGIAQVRTYGRGRNRLSQQIAWRFPREKPLPPRGEGEASTERTWYSEMRMRSSRVVSAGPALGEVESIGDLIDPTSGQSLAFYKQTVRIWRGRQMCEVEIELDLPKSPEGDPWTNYVGLRFAWSDSTLPLTRSVQETSVVVENEQRIESPSYLELADETERTTILTGGLTFHRKTGERMLDTLLVTEGEAARKFRFGIAIDQSFPMQAALDFESPVVALPVDREPPRGALAGWLFQLSVKNVQLRHILPLPTSADAAARGCVVRLLETEGRSRQFKLGCPRTPTRARQVNFLGQPLHEFRIEGGNVLVSIAAHELCDVELTFD